MRLILNLLNYLGNVCLLTRSLALVVYAVVLNEIKIRSEMKLKD